MFSRTGIIALISTVLIATGVGIFFLHVPSHQTKPHHVADNTKVAWVCYNLDTKAYWYLSEYQHESAPQSMLSHAYCHRA